MNDAIHVRESKRFSACIHERLELSFEALFLNPLVGPIASLNAVHRLEHRAHAA